MRLENGKGFFVGMRTYRIITYILFASRLEELLEQCFLCANKLTALSTLKSHYYHHFFRAEEAVNE